MVVQTCRVLSSAMVIITLAYLQEIHKLEGNNELCAALCMKQAIYAEASQAGMNVNIPLSCAHYAILTTERKFHAIVHCFRFYCLHTATPWRVLPEPEDMVRLRSLKKSFCRYIIVSLRSMKYSVWMRPCLPRICSCQLRLQGEKNISWRL